MNTFETNYGKINGIVNFKLHEDYSIKSGLLKEKNIIITKYGELIPQYQFVDVRKKDIFSISFFENGNLRKVALNDPTTIKTSIGEFLAELLTFYNNGNIERLFPLNGQLSAYWEESDEYELTTEYYFSFSFGEFKTIITSISFYEDTSPKSISLWSGKNITINTPFGTQAARLGLSIHPNGNLRSFEPLKPLLVNTPLGEIIAYDYSDKYIFKDDKSICFSENGELISISTSSNKITVIDNKLNTTKSYQPKINSNILDNDDYIDPLKISFEDDFVKINKDTYKINDCTFKIETCKVINNSNIKLVPSNCSNCSSGTLTFAKI